MPARWTARTAAVLALGVVVLSGCSDEQPANDTLPEPTAATSTSSEALPPLGPSDLPMPPEARTQDAAGAEAFTRYYIGLINRTSTVMDAEPLRALSDQCAECNRIAADTERDAAAGYRYQGGELSITWIQALNPEVRAEVAFFADQAALQVIDESGQPVAGLSFEAYPQLSSGATLRWSADKSSWLITSLTLG